MMWEFAEFMKAIYRLFFFFGIFLALFTPSNAPMIEVIIINTRNSQESGVLLASKRSRNTPKTKESTIAEKIPQIRPQSRESCPLFFIIDINPPKKVDV